jgi:hypothetical protein
MFLIGFDFSELHLHIHAVLARGKNYTFSMNRKSTMPEPMSEFFTHPAFLPSFIGFLAGIFLAFFLLSFRLSALRTATLEQEKTAAKTIANLEAEEAALRSDLATLRGSESRLIKRQGELEALCSTEQERQEGMAQHLLQTEAALRDGLTKLENTVLNAIRKSQAREDAMDFVPLVKSQKETPREKNFEGFVMEQPTAKAESAANVFRAALENPNSQ